MNIRSSHCIYVPVAFICIKSYQIPLYSNICHVFMLLMTQCQSYHSYKYPVMKGLNRMAQYQLNCSSINIVVLKSFGVLKKVFTCQSECTKA